MIATQIYIYNVGQAFTASVVWHKEIQKHNQSTSKARMKMLQHVSAHGSKISLASQCELSTAASVACLPSLRLQILISTQALTQPCRCASVLPVEVHFQRQEHPQVLHIQTVSE